MKIEQIDIALSLLVTVLAIFIAKSNFEDIPDLFDGIMRAKKGDIGGVEVFVRGITCPDTLEIAYKAFGSRIYGIYFWFGEFSAALVYILLLGFHITPKTFLSFILIFFVIRSAFLFLYISDYPFFRRFKKSVFSNFSFYFYRLTAYWFALWAALYATDQFTTKTIQFEKTLTDTLLTTSAQASFTIAVGLLIFLSLRKYFKGLHERKEKISDDIGKKLASGDLDLSRDDGNFVRNLMSLEKKMSTHIDDYTYLEKDIDSVNRLPAYVKYYTFFGIYFLLSLREGVSGLPFPDGLMFALFIFFLMYSFHDIERTLRKGLAES